MNYILEEIQTIDKSALINQLIAKGYAFAKWRMPGEDKQVLIVSLNRPEQYEEIDVNSLDSGFLINKFQDNHPGKPFHIKADIVFTNADVRIDPRINAKDIDSFYKSLQERTTKQKVNRVNTKRYFGHEFKDLVEEAVLRIKRGEMDKVVLSRYKDIVLPTDFSVPNYFQTLAKNYSNAFCNIVNLPGEGLWIGATPELLISDNSTEFRTHSLAGTKALENGQSLSDIAWTQKEIEEQAMVSRYIINCFKKIRLREFNEIGPKTVKAANLAHLKTTFSVKHDQVSFDGLASQMLELLHPTSAVCGMPLKTAQEFIKENELYDRSFYAGYLGPVNFEWSTSLFVNLRCMKVDGNRARLFAGAGITEDSDPEKEWQETEMKMGTLANMLF